MFCPICRAEYQPGFTRCSDCEVKLVEELPPRPPRSHHRGPAPPDISAFQTGDGPLSRHALLLFLALPVAAYVALALWRTRIGHTLSVTTGLTALLVCWLIGERQTLPTRPALRLLLVALVATAYMAALLAGNADVPEGLLATARSFLPVALVAGLLAQCLLSPNAGLRRLAQPIVRWRTRWYVYGIALLAWPLLAVTVVLLSRYLPWASAPTADGAFLTETLHNGWLAALFMAPWALAWFGYGVPVLLHRHSALLAAVTLGLLTWSHLAVADLVHSRLTLDAPALCLNLGESLAFAIVAVWLFQRSRGTVWPVLILEGTRTTFLLLNLAGTGFGGGDAALSALVVADAAFAALLVAQGRMWEPPEARTATAGLTGPPAGGGELGDVVADPS